MNSTIMSGMDAVFTCRIKSLTQPNIKWMKQITKAEYKNYVVQNNININPELLLGEPASKPSDQVDSSDDDMLKSFYSMSTLPPLSIVEKPKKADSNLFDEISINDLLTESLGSKNLKQDDFNFELYVPNESKQLKQSRNNINQMTPANDESVHYITLSSSPLITEKVTYNKEQSIYVSKLTIKQASVKDSGIYVCFGGSSNTHRKSSLKVIPASRVQSNSNDLASLFKLQRAKTYMYENKAEAKFDAYSMQSIGLLIVLIPVFLITSFAIASICYLRRLDQQRSKKNGTKSSVSLFNCCAKSEKEKNESKASYCCCPILSHSLIQTFDDVEVGNHQKRSFNKNTLTSNMSDNQSLPCATNSMGSSLSDSSSTTATTVAYYATIPLLLDNNSPPPPLPNSQPPTFSPNSLTKSNQSYQMNEYTPERKRGCDLERTVSTPSMAYYKIVDSDMVNSFNRNEKFSEDAATCVSNNSRFYYQLTPTIIPK